MSVHNPPKWMSRFLVWFVSEELQEEICGDLQEAYQYRRRYQSKLHADLKYFLDVL